MKRIVVIGPESTGKSMLCQGLAAHYNTVWCPEYAREYLLQHGAKYRYEDLTAIAKGQLALEESLAPSATNGLYFIDTDMTVMKVWHEVVFKDCTTWVLKEVARRRYHFYLVCNTDLPWVKDELREYPDVDTRQRLFRMYKDVAINAGVPWAEVKGGYTDRLPSAITAIDAFLQSQPATD